MALDGMFLHFLTEEVSSVIVGAKVDRVHQPTRNELVLHFRTREGMHKLLITADANVPRFNLVSASPENPQTPPMFCMLLRKRLTSATLTAVEQVGLDRVVFFRFRATNEIGDTVNLTLVVEIMAQHSNIILVEENGRIIDAIKRVDSEKSSFRLVLPGAQYVLPPRQNKSDLRTLCAEDAARQILSLPTKQLSAAVLASVEGVSPLLSREIANRVLFSDDAVARMSEAEKVRLVVVLKEIKELLASGAIQPTLLSDEAGKPKDFSFLPIHQYGERYTAQTFSSLSELLAAFYSERDRINRTRSKASELFRQIDTCIERTARKIDVRRAELQKSEDRDVLRVEAELITANQYRLQKGQSVYEVEDYYDENRIRKIRVDPALSASANAQKRYKEYRKACNAAQMLKTLLDEGEADLRYLGTVRDMLERATLEREYAEIKNELISEGFVKPKRSGEKKTMKQALLKPLQFTVPGGYTVLVGRNNLQNDRLTFKTGKKGDVWLHVQKAPGSHVLLVSDGAPLPEEAIVEAAKIAAFYSSQKDGTVVTVDYTDVKNIKKPNGAKPGFVVYYTYWSVNVKPSDGKNGGEAAL